MINKAEFLSNIQLFSLMEKQDIKRIAGRATEMSFRRSDVIIKEGDIDNRLFMVIQGKVEVVKNMGKNHEKWIRTLGPCSYFGEMALIDDLVRSASIVAVEETKTLVLDRWNLHEEIKRFPSIAMELLRMLSRRIRANEKCLLNTIGAFLPICVKCSKICENTSNWVPIEAYIEDHSEAELSNTICPECSRECYPQFYYEDT
jgi:CRP/FNR family cyclic AMP-dependent transcriptional regulator